MALLVHPLAFRPHVIVAVADDLARVACARVAERLGLWPRAAERLADVVSLVRAEPIDVVILDADRRLAGFAHAMERLKATSRRPWLVGLTARTDADDEALRLEGFDGVMRRPFDDEACRGALLGALRRARARRPASEST